MASSARLILSRAGSPKAVSDVGLEGGVICLRTRLQTPTDQSWLVSFKLM